MLISHLFIVAKQWNTVNAHRRMIKLCYTIKYYVVIEIIRAILYDSIDACICLLTINHRGLF